MAEKTKKIWLYVLALVAILILALVVTLIITGGARRILVSRDKVAVDQSTVSNNKRADISSGIIHASELAFARQPHKGSSDREVRVGLYQNKPKIFTSETGQPSGLFIEILEEIARRERWKLIYVPGEWSECLRALEEGRIDLMPDVAFSPERDEKYDFHEEEVIESWSQLYTNKDKPVKNFSDLNGLRLALLKGSIQQKILEEMIKGFGYKVSIVEVHSFEEAFTHAANGAVDVVVSNHLFGDYFYQEYGLVKTTIIFNPVPLYFATASGANHDLLEAIDHNLRIMKSEPGSVFYKILAHWMERPPKVVVPRYLVRIMGGIGGCLALAFVFILLLRSQVKIKTRHLSQTNETLRKSEEKYRTHFENVSDVIFSFDREFRILNISPSLERILGYKPEEFIGKSFAELNILSPEYLEKAFSDGMRVFAGENVDLLNYEFIARDGTKKYVEISGGPLIRDGQVVAVISVARDVTERKRADERLDVEAKRAKILLELYLKAPSLSDKELYDYVLDKAVDLTGSAIGFFHLVDEDQKTIILTTWNSEAFKGCTAAYDTHYSVEEAGNWVDCVRQGKPIIYNDFSVSPNQKGLPEGHTPLKRFMSIPVIEGGKIHYIFGVGNKSGVYEEHDVVQIQLVANELSKIIRQRKADRALKESEKRYRGLFDNVLDMIHIVDKNGIIIDANPIELKTMGYTRDEYIGKRLPEIVHPDFQETTKERFERILKGQNIKLYETVLVTKGSEKIYVEVNAVPLAEGNEIVGAREVVRDVTERKQLLDQVKQRLERLEALRAIDMAITASLDIRVTLSVFLEQVINTLGVDAADVLLLNTQIHNRLAFVAGRGFQTTALRHTNLPIGAGYAGRVAQERKTFCISDLQKESQDFLKQSPQLSNEDFVSYYATPLIAKGQVRGVLEVFNRTPLKPEQEWLDFLEALATQAAIAVDNAELFDDLQKSNIDLLHAYDDTLEGWSKALDLRDKETEGHSQRVTEMTLRLADQMGIRNRELVNVRRGALLHDIGKMGIPDPILLKPGALNKEEWEIMHKHPVYAYELLTPISYLRPALDIPYCHHEKWDGTGYPRGLKGKHIPLAARIFAVVDVWDALCSERPYRPAWPEEKVHEHIKEQTGKHFDPKVVEAFLELSNEFKPE
ncbi:MAG: PAS domain S-box protein [Pseudomonadota bacterium]